MLYAFCPQLMFTGHRSINSQGFIAIDDITVREGACGDQGMLSDTNHLLMLRGNHNISREIILTLPFFLTPF